MADNRLIFGCGYLGRRVAELWRNSGVETHAATRSTARAAEFSLAGLSAIVADVTQPATLSGLPATDAMLFAVGYDRSAGHDIQTVYAGGLGNVLAAAPAAVEHAVYISTTGVYGSAGGDWVDEQTQPDPRRDGGRASLAAEEVLRRHPLGRRSVILRLGGIYGPGRVPYLDTLRAGQPLAVPREGWLNLIHVDDAAAIVIAADAWAAGRTECDGPHVFCVVDGSPVLRCDYYSEVARLVGAAAPTYCPPEAGSPAAARAESNRRVPNAKLLRTLPVALRFPSYREGLSSTLRASDC